MPRQTCHAAIAIAERYSDVPDHKIGIAVLSNPERSGTAIAVVRADSGEVAAADGWWYFHDGELPQDAPTLGDSEWEDWDDMPAKLLWRYNLPWFDSLLPYLLPHYSLAQAAAELVATWAHDPQHPELRSADLVAYFPVADQDTCLGHLRQIIVDATANGLTYRRENAELGLDLLA